MNGVVETGVRTDAARERLLAQGFPPARIVIQRSATLRYQGQSFELQIAFEATTPDELTEAFGAEHERTYGHRAGADEPVEIVALQVVGRGLAERARLPDRLSQAAATPAQRARRAYFGRTHGWCETPVLGRAALATPRAGPAIVEEYDSTCLIPPGATAALDGFGNIVIDL